MPRSPYHLLPHAYARSMCVDGYLCPWSVGDEEQNIEIQLKTFGPQKEKGAVILVVNACSSRDVTENVVGVCFVGQDVTGQKQVLDKFTRIQGDYKAIVQNPNPLIPPIFGTDEYGYCSEWNPSMEKLTGWEREEVRLPCSLFFTLLFAGFSNEVQYSCTQPSMLCSEVISNIVLWSLIQIRRTLFRIVNHVVCSELMIFRPLFLYLCTYLTPL